MCLLLAALFALIFLASLALGSSLTFTNIMRIDCSERSACVASVRCGFNRLREPDRSAKVANFGFKWATEIMKVARIPWIAAFVAARAVRCARGLKGHHS